MATLINGSVDTTGTTVTAASMSIIGVLADAPVIVTMRLGASNKEIDVKGMYHERGNEFRQVGTFLRVRAKSGTANVLVEDNQ